MHVRRILLLTAVFGLCGSAAPLCAQERGQISPPSPKVRVAGLMVWTDGEDKVSEVLAVTGGRFKGSLKHADVHLIELVGTDPELLAIQRVVDQTGLTLSSDWNRRVQVPEDLQCGPQGEVGAQQCTIAFVDGNPSSHAFAKQPMIKAVHAEQAQKSWWTSPVTVAVIDTGIDPTHRIFINRLASVGWDYLEGVPGAFDVKTGKDSDFDGDLDEAWGHGTHVAGTILALNPAARILPLRVLDSDGIGTAFVLARAIEDAVDMGASIINLSLSMSKPSFPVAMALLYAQSRGVAVFTSAGNMGAAQVLFPGNFSVDQFPQWEQNFPASSPVRIDPVVTVSSIDSNRVKSGFASYGRPVDLVTLGEDIYSAFPDNGYALWSGTSMACAVASGAASLLLSNHPQASPHQVVRALIESSHSVDFKNPEYAGLLGSGRIHVWHATIELWKMLH